MVTYQNNFHRGQTGNKLAFGKDLKIRIPGATIVTARLERKDSGGLWKIIQIEQSGRKSNPWKDMVKFEMIDFDGKGGYASMPSGEYRVKVWFWKDNRGGSFTDKFEIE